jgi:hypothetical protein
MTSPPFFLGQTKRPGLGFVYNQFLPKLKDLGHEKLINLVSLQETFAKIKEGPWS